MPINRKIELPGYGKVKLVDVIPIRKFGKIEFAFKCHKQFLALIEEGWIDEFRQKEPRWLLADNIVVFCLCESGKERICYIAWSPDDPVLQDFKRKVGDMRESKLKEGGNLTVNGKTGEHSATKLRIKDMSLDQYSSFKKDFISFLYGINERFEDEYGYPVWEKPELLQTGRMFSGSTRTLFTKEFEEYSARKPKIGDFDIQVPESCFEDFHKFILEEMVDQSVGDWTIYGCSKSPGQDHSLVQADKNYPNVDAEYLQIDWEYVPFTNGEPTEFATFAHYSSWEDLGHNIKGAFRQKLVRALTSTIDERENVVIVSEKTGKPRGQFTKGGIVHFMGYSVDKGVRTKFKPYLDENGNQVMIDGKEAWCEAATKDSYYEQDMGAIFQLIFGYEPTEKDKRDLFSFVRTVNYLMKSLDEERVRKVFKLYIADIWGPAGQRLSAFDPNEDREWKTTSCNEFIKAFPYLKEYLPEIQEMQKTYYSNYKTMEKK